MPTNAMINIYNAFFHSLIWGEVYKMNRKWLQNTQKQSLKIVNTNTFAVESNPMNLEQLSLNL